MPLTDFSKHVGDALLREFPQFKGFVHVDQHLEIRFPHPKAAAEMIITTAGEEISIFLGSDHRHIGMCQQWTIEKQLARAQELIGGILSGTVLLARSSKHPGLWIDEDRSRAEHPDLDENITFMTWNDLSS